MSGPPTELEAVTNLADWTGPAEYTYAVYGLTVRSYFELKGYPKAASNSVPDLVIRQGTLDGIDKSSSRQFRALLGSSKYSFHWDWIGSFLVRHGREIIIDPSPDADDDRIQHALPSVIFGAVLHQRGHLVLHASGVAIDKGGVAFVGQKFAGKSTMSAALHARGHDFLTDDAVALEMRANGHYTVFPGIPRMHLWPDTVGSLIGDPDGVPSLYDGGTKKGVDTSDGYSRRPVPLRAIYVLSIGDRISIEPIPMREALVELLPHAWAARFIEDHPSVTATLFEEFAPLVRAVPVRRLIRRAALDELPQVAEALEEDVARLVGSP